MNDIATTTLNELCGEAGRLIRGIPPRRVRAEVISHRPAGPNIWASVVEDGTGVDVLMPAGLLKASGAKVERGTVLDLDIETRANVAEGEWYCVATKIDWVSGTGPVARRREAARRSLVREKVIRRRPLDDKVYSGRVRDVKAAKRVTALVPKSGRTGWWDVAGQLRHLPNSQVTVLPMGGRGRTMAQGCTEFLNNLAPGDADVVAIIRGGGNKAGLATFDDAALARAIHASPVPVVTGIGHREDVSLADAAAHAAFPTPGEAGSALSFATNGPKAVFAAKREAERAAIEHDRSKLRTRVSELEREVARLQAESQAARSAAARDRRTSEDAHRWINAHLVEDALGRVRRRADRRCLGLILLASVLLMSVAVGWTATAGIAGAAIAVALAVWVMWGPTRAVRRPRRGDSHVTWTSAHDWRSRVASSRSPRELRALHPWKAHGR